MYFRSSVVGKASTIDTNILPTSPLIFTGGQKVRNSVSISTSLNSEPPAFENAERYPNSETKVQCCDDRPMSWLSWVHAPLRKLCQFCPTPKIAHENVLNRQYLSRGLFRSNFAESLNAWHPMCRKSSRSRGQRSKSQHELTCAKIRKIIITSAGDCLILLKFCTEFDHATFDVPQTFKVNG